MRVIANHFDLKKKKQFQRLIVRERERESWSLRSNFKGDILKGEVALITGGGSGIGFEIFTQFGKYVAIMGRRRAVAELRSKGIQVRVPIFNFCFVKIEF